MATCSTQNHTRTDCLEIIITQLTQTHTHIIKIVVFEGLGIRKKIIEEIFRMNVIKKNHYSSSYKNMWPYLVI